MTLRDDLTKVFDAVRKVVDEAEGKAHDILGNITPAPPEPVVPTKDEAPTASEPEPEVKEPANEEPPADPNAHVPAPSGAVVETSGTVETTASDVNQPVPAGVGQVIETAASAVSEGEHAVSDTEKVVEFVKSLEPEALAVLKEALKVL